MSNFIVAIDGPAAAGKSTVSRQVAAELGGVHVDSGSLYRGLTWQCLRAGADCGAEPAVVGVMRNLRLDYFLDAGSVHFTFNGEDPGAELRSDAVAEQVSAVAAMPRVRAWMVERLRGLTRCGSLVMEGRDIGTVVFPNAPFKFYLDATPEERARRRLADQAAGSGAPAFSRIKTLLLRRDARDSGRAAAPLARAPDARLIDTTGLPLADVVAAIVGAVRAVAVER